MSEEKKSIPTSKVERASKMVSTGLKVGGNYVKHYGKRLVGTDVTQDDLDKDNAETIYDALSEMKGSALKMAQMMSMDTQTLPKAFTEKFSMAQYSAPPLSGPLVVKSFKTQLGGAPHEVYDSFDMKAKHAASIGQVHEAFKDGKKLAVKIQYPGVGDSVKSDLRLVKPFALRFLKLKEKEVKVYFDEVERMLLEETDYDLELSRGMEMYEACLQLTDVLTPVYYPELSADRVITMDWIEGIHLNEFIESNPSEADRQKVGQALWDFYNFQMHDLKKMHADPHPGNFLVTAEVKLAALDFGCVKEIPEGFYDKYFSFLSGDVIHDDAKFIPLLEELTVLLPSDTNEERKFFIESFRVLLDLLTRPYHTETFDFGNDKYFQDAFELGEKLGKEAEKKGMKAARGSEHFIYLNRTFFGLYSLLNQLKANVKTNTYIPEVQFIPLKRGA